MGIYSVGNWIDKMGRQTAFMAADTWLVGKPEEKL